MVPVMFSSSTGAPPVTLTFSWKSRAPSTVAFESISTSMVFEICPGAKFTVPGNFGL